MAKGNAKNCRPRSLVRGRVARIDCCADCGCISIHVGPTTLRMDEHALRSLWLTIGEAVEALEDGVPGSASASIAHGHA